MIASSSIDDLARRIRSRRSNWPDDDPYVLFLGEGCGQAAGAPSRGAIAREALRVFGREAGESSKDETDASVFEEFSQLTETFSGPQFARMVRSLYASVPVPSFYEDLAVLIREGFFPLVLTTNFDTLLEQALAATGLRASDYRVTTFGLRGTSTPPDVEPLANWAPPTHIVKLHGDLAQDQAHVTPDEIQAAFRRSQRWIKPDLKADLIMVAHHLADDPIDRWLASSPDRELWWVNLTSPTDEVRVRSWAREYQEITGEAGDPRIFFPQLSLRLIAPREPAETAAAADPWADSEVLRFEILRNQSNLYSLEQKAVRSSGERPIQVQAQIDYQKRALAKLEDKIRSLPDTKRLVLDVVKRIVAGIEKANAAPSQAGGLSSLFDYGAAQLRTLEEELQKNDPNQFLIAASLGATLALANRLLTDYGAGVVKPDDVKQLAELAPSAAAKVVL